MPIYRCPRCGRTVEKPYGTYYCMVCGPTATLQLVSKATIEEIGERYVAGMAKAGVRPGEEIKARYIRGIIESGRRLSGELKTYIRESLAYALNTSVKDATERRLVVEEFYAALNRRGVLTNEEAEAETREALKMIVESA